MPFYAAALAGPVVRSVLGRYHPLLLGAVWLGVQVLLYQRLGVKVVYDSHRYLAHAQALAGGQPLAWNYHLLYLGYTALLAGALALQVPLGAVVGLQVAASGLAAVALYRLTHYLTDGRRLAAALATLAYVAWPDLQAWNFYIHTDSLFTSLLVLYSSALLRVRRPWQALPLLPVLLWLWLLRPNGLLVVLATLAYGLALLWERNRRVFWRVAGGLAAGALLVLPPVAGALLRAFVLLPVYQSGSLFGGHPFLAVSAEGLRLLPATSAASPGQQFLYYIWHNPAHFLTLFLLKLGAFFAQLRPYFSPWHNAAIALLLYPVYYWAARAVVELRVPRPARWFFLTLIGLQAGISALTLPDWDNRFMAPLLPGLFLLAAAALAPRLQGRAND